MATLLILKERIHLKAGRFDHLGALLIAVGMAGLTAGLSFGQEQGWTSPLILTLLLLGLLALVTLPFVEQRVWQEDCRPRPPSDQLSFPAVWREELLSLPSAHVRAMKDALRPVRLLRYNSLRIPWGW